ncbi:hypothetical protein [Alteraurantiacibacter aquimixticola]|uniref:Lipoprotein n=1 Tax=Alteraurantiacibacter aquimixticola TaxID=2489173 RepID=A0A4T3F2B7_9SPHN|nr:hypothetical protein [Alteraurantiacibacter aquimixticola]TIX50210.1 hypothetical protein E5222_07930 [Alteraurantiacibacter aquimixticola]
MAVMKPILPLIFTACALSGCATYSDAPIVDAGPIASEGSMVALGEPVAVEDVVLTPMKVTEDSRCPINARCVWAGRIVVETRVDGAGWRETVPVTLGEPESVRGYVLNLVSAEPGQMAGADPVGPEDYRFAYEGWSPDNPPD